MKIIVQMRPGSSQAKVEKIDEGQYRVWVHSIPEKGKANAEMLKLLADYFQVAKSSVRIVIGKTAREKLVEIIGGSE
ncbi:MAG: DUF167 domain-containing protein [Candidatus Andersenbacteria bacterium]|nr:DUF167 domain-containing protein [Candidatus Andersenbacteria bacterium]MBI3250823.1 DUF167 domain-containing protein [Candidatus Andersenbacteria bacterium]